MTKDFFRLYNYNTLCEKISGGYRYHSVCLSIRRSAKIPGRLLTFFCFWHWLIRFGTHVYPLETIRPWSLISSSNWKGKMHVFISESPLLLLWHSLSIVGTWIYLNEGRYVVDLWLQAHLFLGFNILMYDLLLLFALAWYHYFWPCDILLRSVTHFLKTLTLL